jgi:hypothetical protein
LTVTFVAAVKYRDVPGILSKYRTIGMPTPQMLPSPSSDERCTASVVGVDVLAAGPEWMSVVAELVVVAGTVVGALVGCGFDDVAAVQAPADRSTATTTRASGTGGFARRPAFGQPMA